MPTEYASFDLETTGLDTRADQVLQVACVYERVGDVPPPVEELPYFECLVEHERYEGSAYALALNEPIFSALASAKEGPNGTKVAKLHGRNIPVYRAFARNGLAAWEDELRLFLEVQYGRHVKPGCITLAGHNVAGFDLQFVQEPKLRKLISHRVLDVGSAFAAFDENGIPSSQNLYDRFGFGKVTHDALDDARNAVRILRKKYSEGAP